jgi:hypothetical protein
MTNAIEIGDSRKDSGLSVMIIRDVDYWRNPAFQCLKALDKFRQVLSDKEFGNNAMGCPSGAVNKLCYK